MADTRERLLFSGPFGGPYREAARDALGRHADAGARDILYITASGAARRGAIADLVARRRAVFGVRAVSLSSLPLEIARRARVRPSDRIDPAVDALLIERAVRGACGDKFPGGAPIPGISDRVAASIDVLERSHATPDALRESLAKIEAEGDGPVLLECAWRAVDLARTGKGRTPAAIMAESLALLRGRPDLLARCDTIIIEDLPLATPLDRELIAAVVNAAPGVVIAAHGHAPQLASGPATRALESLRVMAAWDEVQCPLRAGSLSGALTRIFAVGSTGTAATRLRGPSVEVTRLEASGEVGEIRLAARVIRRHLRAGARPSDIQIVVHGGERYYSLIDEILRGASIPVAARVSRAVAETGIGSVLLRLLAIAVAEDDSTIDESLAVARAPHIDLPVNGADRLHQHVVNTGRLGLEGWNELSRKVLDGRTINRVTRLRRTVEAARNAFAKAESPEACARIVRSLAKDLRLVGNAYFVRQRVASGAAAAGLRASADNAIREDNQAWEAIASALERTVPAMIDAARVPRRKGGRFARDWAAMLKRALDSTTVPGDAGPADAVAITGSGPGMDRPAKVTIVVGLLERRFPRAARQDPLLKDDVRRALHAHRGWELPLSEDTADRERECFLRSISTATEALYLSCAAVDSAGKPAVKSFFIDDLQRALDPDQLMRIERAATAEAVPVAEASTTSELLAAVSHDLWQHLPRDAAHRRTTAFAAYEAMRGRGVDTSALTHGRDAVQRPVFAPGVLAHAPHATLRLSASQLKSLGHCTFRHFVEKVLDPKSIAAPGYDALTKGSLIHDAMVEWAKTLGGWQRGEQVIPQLASWYDACVEKWPPAQRSKIAQHSARQDWERLDALLRTELSALAQPGVARPVYHELAFGAELTSTGARDAASRDEPFDLELPLARGATTVHFRGSLDRVDVVELGGVRYGVVIDYKTGATSKFYADEMEKGLDLQLRLYMLALREFWGIEPIGALYLGFGDGIRRGAIRARFASHIAGIDPDVVTSLDEEAWHAFVSEQTTQLMVPIVERLIGVDITPAPRERKCGFCEMQPICRYDPFAREVAIA